MSIGTPSFRNMSPSVRPGTRTPGRAPVGLPPDRRRVRSPGAPVRTTPVAPVRNSPGLSPAGGRAALGRAARFGRMLSPGGLAAGVALGALGFYLGWKNRGIAGTGLEWNGVRLSGNGAVIIGTTTTPGLSGGHPWFRRIWAGDINHATMRFSIPYPRNNYVTYYTPYQPYDVDPYDYRAPFAFITEPNVDPPNTVWPRPDYGTVRGGAPAGVPNPWGFGAPPPMVAPGVAPGGLIGPSPSKWTSPQPYPTRPAPARPTVRPSRRPDVPPINIDVRPGGAVTVGPGRNSRPPRGTTERKVRSPLTRFMSAVLDAGTEGLEILETLLDAGGVPPGDFADRVWQFFADGYHHNVTPDVMMDIWNDIQMDRPYGMLYGAIDKGWYGDLGQSSGPGALDAPEWFEAMIDEG